MASTTFIHRTAIGVLWALALWHGWVCRGLFVDGSKLLIDMVRYEWFVTFRDPRFFTEVAGQALPVAGVRAGITDLHVLAQLLSLDLFALPTLFYSLALWRARREPVLLAAVMAAIGIVFMTTSYFIVGEYNTAYALAVLAAVLLATTVRLEVGEGLLLLGVAVFFSHSYEVTLYLGPLLAAMTVWRVATAPSRPVPATALYLLCGAVFLGGMAVAIHSLIEPFDPEHLESTYQEAPNFWQNLMFNLAFAAASVVVVWGAIRPADLGRRLPYLWGGIFVAALALLPLMALFDTLLRPLARSQYVARLAAGLVIAAIAFFMWAYVAGFHRAVPALVQLRRPEVGRRFLVFAALLALSTVPADILLTANWIHYLETLKAVVRSNTGVVAVEDTPLSRLPDLLLVENWALPSQSLVVRAKDGDAVVAPFRDYRGWSPFAPERAPGLGRFYWRD